MRTRYFWIPILLTLSIAACTKKKEAEPHAAATVAEATLPGAQDLPDTVMGTLIAGNPSTLLSEMEKLGGKVSPVPPGSLNAMVIQMLLEIGLKDTSVIDLKAPVALVLLDPKKYPEPIVAACGVTSEDKVLESLQPAWKHKGASDNIHELVKDVVDTYGVFQGNAEKAPPAATQTFYLKFAKKTLYAANQRESLLAGIPVLEKLLASPPPATGASGVVLVDHLRRVYQAEITQGLQAAKEALAQDSQLQALEDMKPMMDWTVDKLFSSVQQTKEIPFALALSQDGIDFRVGFAAEQDSFFQKLLAAQKPGGCRLTAALPADHFLGAGLNLQWSLFKDDLVAFTREIFKLLLKKEVPPEYLATLNQLLEILGDEIAISETLGTDGIQITELFAVRDEAKARTVVAEMLQLTAKLFADGEGIMGMKFDFAGPKPLAAYNQIPLDLIEVDFRASSLPAEQMEIMKKMYGDKMRMIMAVFDGQMAMTIGKKAEEDMKALIDRVRKKEPGLVGSEAFRSAAGPQAPNPGSFMFLSISQLIGASLESAMAMMGKGGMSLKLPPPASGMFFGFQASPAMLTMDVRLPARHLTEIGEAVKSMMTQASLGQ